MTTPALLLPLLLLLLLLQASLAAVLDIGLTCSQHLLPVKPSNPVLIRSWSYLNRTTQIYVRGNVVYHPRFSAFSYIPVVPYSRSTSPSTITSAAASQPPDTSPSQLPPPDTLDTSWPVSRQAPTNNPDKYTNLDLFYAQLPFNRPGNMAIRLYFQRPARVYLFVNTASYRPFNPPTATLPGWSSEGWARLRSPSLTYLYGIHQKATMRISTFSYVFSLRTSGDRNVVNLPQFMWLRDQIVGISANGVYHVRVAELDGTASTVPHTVLSLTGIKANARCPDALHDMWRVEDKRGGDPSVKGLMWPTWHPQYDPCYWCAYDHEHGSSAPVLMDYYPTYGLTEHKRENGGIESNNGFKDMVADIGLLRWYISVHAQTSSLRRSQVRHHTVTIVIRNRATRQIVLDISVKADFGFLAARQAGDNNRFIAMTAEGVEMFREQMKRVPFLREFRSMNFINRDQLDERLLYENPILRGTYEEWICNLLCTGSPRRGELTFDVQDPITAAKDASGTEKVNLGRNTHMGFRRHVGVQRTVRARDLRVSLNNCRKTLGAEFAGGVFYTDAYGLELRDGPGRNNVRQFIRPGFSAALSGKFQPAGPWLGLHTADVNVHFEDLGFGIDPDQN